MARLAGRVQGVVVQIAAAGERGHVDCIVTHPDARHHLHCARERAFHLAEARETEDHAMDLAARLQERVESAARDRGGKRHDFDVVACVEHLAAALTHDVGD